MASATVLYDSDCGLCTTLLAGLLAWDRARRLHPVPIQSPEGERLLADLTPEQRMDSWHIVSGDGVRRSAGAGFAPLLRLLAGGPPLAALAERYPRGAERAYRLVAGNRSGLGPAIPDAVKRRARARVEARRRASA